VPPICVPAEEFRDRLNEFDWVVVWTSVQANELIACIDAIKAIEAGFPAEDFPDFEIAGAVTPARADQGSG
jgi:hypothetical protein